jgi:hypothetical protein
MRLPVSKEIYIRLADDQSAFVYTSKYCGFFSKAIRVALQGQSQASLDDAEAPSPQVKKQPRSLLGLSDDF